MTGRALIGLVTAAGLLAAAGTTSWELNDYQEFAKGRMTGLSLGREGILALAPRLEPVFSSDQHAIWSVAQGPDGSIYLGTGHRGRLYRIDPAGRASLLWTAPEPEIFAVTVAPDGAVYAGSSPDGKIWRIHNGRAAEYFAPGERYIWSLAAASDGALYAGTGGQGRVYRITATGKGEIWYESGQSHVTSLAFDGGGALLAGTEPNGILYRVTEKDKAFTLYDSDFAEIRSLARAADGSLYVAAMGSSIAQRTSPAAPVKPGATPARQVTAPGTSITVTEEAQAGLEVNPKADASKPAQAPPAAVMAAAPLVDLSAEKSALYRINPDNTVETLWTSRDENAYDVALAGDDLLFATDAQGRIYRISGDRSVSLIAQTSEGETTRLLPSRNAILAATSSMGKLFRLGDRTGTEGEYESPVHDAGSVARWGKLIWHVEQPTGTRVVFRTRTGNSVRPDRTWSNWSEPLSDPLGSAVKSPNARFIQWKAEFRGAAGATPELRSVNVSYLPQNNPPAVKFIHVSTQATAAAAARPSAQASPSTGAANYSVTVTDTAEPGPATSAGTPTQAINRGLTHQIQIVWQGEDPDEDKLVYAVYFRGEEEREWKLLKDRLTEQLLTLEGDVFADGKYLFRVVASDRLANPGGSAREAEMVSSPALFDGTPPRVQVAAAGERQGGRVEVTVEAADAASPLRRAEYSLDAGPWTPLAAEDSVIDSREERFLVRLDGVAAGEHLLVVRVYDSAGNAGLAKLVVR
ncbi:MAG: hypothetical protein HYZ57_13365 [Acidobacteria bacterium]|nr:hypothetical protein [Acidobacteriota bacterium]MBI3280821.1 hypothetical protein [Acidobacteriota bacterium]